MSRIRLIIRLVCGVAVGIGLLLSPAVEAQQKVIGRVKNFSITPEFHPAPYEKQMKSLLQGAEAVPSDGGRLITVKDGKLQTFSVQGQRELLVEAPECVYDSTTRSIRSAGVLKAHTADGNFSIEGRGFTWQTTNSSLTISNAVRTFVHPNLLRNDQAPTNAPAEDADLSEGIAISSDTFEFLADTGTGIYRRNVRVQGTNMTMNAGELTIRIPTNERQLETISAEQNVVANYGEIHATGEHVVYSNRTGIIHVSGQPTWRAERREGRADHVMIDRTNRIFLATGNSWLKLPGQALGPANLLSAQASGPAQKPAAANSFLEIRADSYELRTNWGVFRKSVSVTERDGEQAAGSMTAEEMTVVFSGTNQMDRLTADRNVVIQHQEVRLTGDKAVYTAEDGLLVLTGTPAWDFGPRRGKGRELRLNAQTKEMQVLGNASMRVPAEEFGQLTEMPGLGGPAPKTNRVGQAEAEVNTEFAEIFSEQYTFSPTQARFLGGVYISHPRMNWSSEDLTIRLSAEQGPVESIIAQDGVKFDLLDRAGQKVHGKGEKAVYTYAVRKGVTNDFVELSGEPQLERVDAKTGNRVVVRDRVLILDRARNEVVAPTQYSIQGWGRIEGTNTLKVPQLP